MCENKFVILKTTFDEAYRKYSLGKLNLYKLIEYVHQSVNCTHIDFYTNASKDQIDWATDQRPMFNITIYGHRIVDKVLAALLDMRARLKLQAKADKS